MQQCGKSETLEGFARLANGKGMASSSCDSLGISSTSSSASSKSQRVGQGVDSEAKQSI